MVDFASELSLQLLHGFRQDFLTGVADGYHMCLNDARFLDMLTLNFDFAFIPTRGGEVIG